MSIKRILLKKKYWIIAVLIIIIGGYFYFGRGGAAGPETVKVTKRTITQEISATGNVKPSQNVDLAFETSGKINSVEAKVGEYVSAGQILASLDITELNAQLDKAQADLASQRANLNKANTDLANYYTDIIDTINSAYTSANDAVRIKIDSLFSDDETNNPKLSFDTSASQDKTSTEYQRVLIKTKLNNWLSQISGTKTDSSRGLLEQTLADSRSNLNAIYDFLNLLMGVTINSQSLSVSTLNTYKTNINDARSEIDSAISKVNSLVKNISSQKASILSLEASVKSYEAGLNNINAQISKTVMRSPISGVVTKQEAKTGEIVSPNSVITSIISSGSYEVDSNIPEVDIARVKVGDSSRITLDAYGNDIIFDATVISIDPGETIIEGVSTYLTKLHFVKYDSRIKPGMTANIDVVSAKHENVLSIPQRAIQKKTEGESVLLYKGTIKNVSSTEERKITTGLRGVDGYTEILSGLAEGQEIVIPRQAK